MAGEASMWKIAVMIVIRNSLAPLNSMLLEDLIVALLVKKLQDFQQMREYITFYTRACHRTLSWA
jgi:hypothetical protein